MTQHTVRITLAIALLLVCTGVVASANTLTITATRAEVRAGPDVKRAILATVSQGATFSLLETRKGWYKIFLEDGREGWVAQAAARVQSERGFVVTPAAASAAQARTALVIGNAAYINSPLRNPVNDATAIAAALEQMGFQVVLMKNAKRDAMLRAIADLGNRLTHGGVGLFFFAGHGLQVKGENYLVPVEAPLGSDTLEDNMVPAQRVIDRMEEAKNGFNTSL